VLPVAHRFVQSGAGNLTYTVHCSTPSVTQPHLTPKLKKEQSYTSTSLLELHSLY